MFRRTNVKVSLCKTSDVAYLIDCTYANYNENRVGYIPSGFKLNIDNIRTIYNKLLNEGIILKAEAGDEAIGSVVCYLYNHYFNNDYPCGEIIMTYIRKDYRETTVLARILRELEKRLREKGIPAVGMNLFNNKMKFKNSLKYNKIQEFYLKELI